MLDVTRYTEERADNNNNENGKRQKQGNDKYGTHL